MAEMMQTVNQKMIIPLGFGSRFGRSFFFLQCYGAIIGVN